MTLFMLVWFLTLVSSVCAAAVHHPRQNLSLPSPSTACPVTVVEYVTITHIPPTVTIAVPDQMSISKSLASASTIDSIVVVENSQNAPISGPRETAIPTFLNTIVVPAFEATEAPASGSSVYYVSIGRNTTNWSYTPTESITVGVTTISVIPQAANGTGMSTTTRTTTLSTAEVVWTVHASFTPPNGGWNGTAGATSVSPQSGSGFGLSGSFRGTGGLEGTSYGNNTVANRTVTSAASVTIAPSLEGGYGSPINSWTTGTHWLEKRQTCTMISADTGNGQWGSWCNNWDGHTTLTYTSWETTVVPGQSSTHPTAANPSSSPVESATTVGSAEQSSEPVTGSMRVPSTSPTTAAPSAGAQPISCGQTGDFEISFDDLPEQSVFPNETAGQPPIFNPFDHFYWAPGWTYGPPPSSPYSPHNGDTLAIYNVTLEQSTNNGQDSVGSMPYGGFSAGRRMALDQYWFNATSAWVGCQNNLNDPSGNCDFVAEAYRWDNTAGKERLVVTQHFSQPLCHHSTCELHQIYFNEAFTRLTTMNFYAKIDGSARDFYVDDMQMGWWNNTCEAGLLRASSRK